MSVDFQQAAHRHFKDAEALGQLARHQNADHFYGLAAECALKAVLTGLGLIADPVNPRPYKQHINKLWGEYLSALQALQGGRYSQRLSSANPFQDWRVDDRYEADWPAGPIPAEAIQRRDAVRNQVLSTLQDFLLDKVPL